MSSDKKITNYWGKVLHFPEDVLYSNELMWVRIEADNKLRVGISDLGVRAVKYLDYVRLKVRAGKELKRGDLMGMVDTSKMVWEIIAPVSGKVVAMNEEITREGNPSLVIEDNYGAGWIAQLEKTRTTDSELKQLHKGSDAAGKKWIAEIVEANVPLQQT